MKILTVFGTRPEAIKMAPLVNQLRENPQIISKVCVTGQHREMLDQVLSLFEIEPDYDLNIMKESQTLQGITTSIIEKLTPVLEEFKPHYILVHGDTTTTFAASLAAFYQKIPVGHVEAGLRTNDMYSPFPEEMNRLLTDRISSIYFAPTEQNKENLLKEGVVNNVYVTGNTVIDSFAITVKKDYAFHNQTLKGIDFNSKRVVLVTAHRRENLGTPIENICDAIYKLAHEYSDVVFIYPVHLNPAIRNIVFTKLANIKNIFLIDPVDVLDMHNMMARCYMVMTDSGGIQEEAPHFGKPVLVLRTETERPEAVKAGTVMVVGVDSEKIYKSAKDLLDDSVLYSNMARAVNPYGDGHAGKRIADLLLKKAF